MTCYSWAPSIGDHLFHVAPSPSRDIWPFELSELCRPGVTAFNLELLQGSECKTCKCFEVGAEDTSESRSGVGVKKTAYATGGHPYKFNIRISVQLIRIQLLQATLWKQKTCCSDHVKKVKNFRHRTPLPTTHKQSELRNNYQKYATTTRTTHCQLRTSNPTTSHRKYRFCGYKDKVRLSLHCVHTIIKSLLGRMRASGLT